MAKDNKNQGVFKSDRLLVSLIGFIVFQKIITNSRFKSDFHKPENRNEAWRQDLTHFQDNYSKVCKSFPKDSVYKANQIIDSIKQNIDRYSDSKIQLLISSGTLRNIFRQR